MAQQERYDAFISYSHAADGSLVPRLQQGLQRFAKPWWRRRALRVFRDEAGLSANVHLWDSVREVLDGSQWLVLLLSPHAAASVWVNREIEHWLAHKPVDHILPVLTDGDLVWSEEQSGFDVEASTSLPPRLHGVFRDEPRYVDLRWARSETLTDLGNPRFRAAVADLAAPMHGVAKDDLESEEVRQHRRTRRTAWSAAMALLLLTVLSISAGVVAVQQRARAAAQAESATARAAGAQALLQADVRVDRSLLLGAQAVDMQPSPETMSGLLAGFGAAPHLVGFRQEFEPQVVDLTDFEHQTRVVSVTVQGDVVVRDTTTWKTLAATRLEDAGRITGVEVVADDRQIAVYSDRGARLLATESLQPLTDWLQDPSLRRKARAGQIVTVSSSGKFYAAASRGGRTATVAETSTGRTVTKIDRPCQNTGGSDVGPMDFSPDEHRLYVTCFYRPLVVFDARNGQKIASLHAIAGGTRGGLEVAAGPGGRAVAVILFPAQVAIANAKTLEWKVFNDGLNISTPDTLPEVIRWADGRLLSGDIYGAARGSDSVLLIGVDNGDTVIWDTAGPYYERHEVERLTGLDDGITGIAVLPRTGPAPWTYEPGDRLRLLLATTSSVSLWDVAQPMSLGRQVAVRDYPYGAQVSLSSGRVVTTKAGPSGHGHSKNPHYVTIRVGDLNGQPIARFRLPYGKISVAGLDRTGQRLAVMGQVYDSPVSPSPSRTELVILDVSSGQVTARLEVPPRLFRVRRSVGESYYIPEAPVFSPDGKRLMMPLPVLGTEGSLLPLLRAGVAVWDVRSGVLEGLGPTERIDALAPVQFNSALPDPRYSLHAWSPDSRVVLTALPDGSVVHAWDAATMRPVGRVDLGADVQITHLFTGLGAEVLAATGAGEVQVIDVDTMRTDKEVYRGGVGASVDVAVSPDGRYLAAVNQDGVVALWNAERRLLGPPLETGHPVDPDSDDLLEFSDSATLRLLVARAATFEISLDPASLVDRACSLVGRGLTDEEWSRYLGSVSYPQAC